MTTNTIPKDSRWTNAFGSIKVLKPEDIGYVFNMELILIEIGLELDEKTLVSRVYVDKNLFDHEFEDMEQVVFDTMIDEIDKKLNKAGYNEYRTST